MVIARNLPKTWTASDIIENLNDKFISKINFIKNINGENTGKVILHYQSEKEAKIAIKYHQGKPVLDTHIFLEIYEGDASENKKKAKEETTHKNFQQRLSSRVYIRNISQEATKDDIIAITKNIADIEEIKFPRHTDGKHMGFAIVYLKNPDQVSNFINALDNKTLFDKEISLTMKLETASIGLNSKMAMYSNYTNYIKRKHMSTLKEVNLENSYLIKSGIKHLLEPYHFESDRRERFTNKLWKVKIKDWWHGENYQF